MQDFLYMIYKVAEKLVLLFGFPALRNMLCVLDATIDFMKRWLRWWPYDDPLIYYNLWNSANLLKPVGLLTPFLGLG